MIAIPTDDWNVYRDELIKKLGDTNVICDTRDWCYVVD